MIGAALLEEGFDEKFSENPTGLESCGSQGLCGRIARSSIPRSTSAGTLNLQVSCPWTGELRGRRRAGHCCVCSLRDRARGVLHPDQSAPFGCIAATRPETTTLALQRGAATFRERHSLYFNDLPHSVAVSGSNHLSLVMQCLTRNSHCYVKSPPGIVGTST